MLDDSIFQYSIPFTTSIQLSETFKMSDINATRLPLAFVLGGIAFAILPCVGDDVNYILARSDSLC